MLAWFCRSARRETPRERAATGAVKRVTDDTRSCVTDRPRAAGDESGVSGGCVGM
ncbi:formate dehydrogenase [Burkholderia pseudomallei]|uniref:formate dehydrogenase n=1 Tax=Burkholderia pseudomallei TaxID=28450 RepID=UPI0009B1C191|nr:formate dehydrogenase [Burkholderia pseudomallei]